MTNTVLWRRKDSCDYKKQGMVAPGDLSVFPKPPCSYSGDTCTPLSRSASAFIPTIREASRLSRGPWPGSIASEALFRNTSSLHGLYVTGILDPMLVRLGTSILGLPIPRLWQGSIRPLGPHKEFNTNGPEKYIRSS